MCKRAPDGAPVVPDTAAETLARPSTTRGSIFLSYASEDQAVAERIRGILEAARLDVWLDKERLAGGDEYESFIRSCIESSSLFLPLISRHTLASPERRFYRLEWKHAQRVAQEVAESERFIVPVAIDETSPDEEGIPAAFGRLHWERHPDGQLSRDFVDDLTGRFRRYQEMLAGAS